MSSRSQRPRTGVRAACALALLLAAVPASAQTHLDNAFVGATPYVNPDYTAQAEASAAAATDPALAAAMRQVGVTPTAVWLESISQVPLVATHLDRAVAAGSDLVVFVLHDLPGHDCHALVLQGMPTPTADDLARYRTQFIDAVAAIAGQPRYAGVRIVFVVEPGGLSNLVTNLSDPDCAAIAASGIYVQGVQYAVNTLHAIPNVYLYLDLAHAAWFGWSENAAAMVSLLEQVSRGFTAGKSALDGFATNVGAYIPTKEPYLTTGRQTLGTLTVASSKFYDWDPQIDDAGYAADMYARLVNAGWPATIGVITDTSRNGWGGPQRPTGPSTETVDINKFVDGSRVDRRAHRQLWCNPAGAGVGLRPRAAPEEFLAAHYDAYVWLRSPGQSDGASADVYDSLGYNPECNPTYITQWGVATGALPDAPLPGRWFPAQFTQLVQNVWPALDAPTTYPLNVSRSGGVGTVTSTPAGIDCGTACVASYAEGTPVTLTANPIGASTFGGWSGACSGTALTCVVSMTEARRVSAAFVGDSAFTLTMARAGAGSGVFVSTPGGFGCGTACTVTLAAGSTVTLTALASIGSVFTGWSGDCSAVAGPTCAVVMNGNRLVTASFGSVPSYALTVTRAGTGAGTVTSTPYGISCGATCSATYPGGTVLTLTATATDTTSRFAGWSGGGCSGAATTCPVVMSEARSVTATFTAVPPPPPCDGAITFTNNTGNFDTKDAVCYRTAQKVNGWGCANVQGRIVVVNGGPPAVSCGGGPFPLARWTDGYTYFWVTAGMYPWASLYVW